jgi:plastocyanin
VAPRPWLPALGLALALVAAGVAHAASGTVEGRIALSLPGLEVSDVGELVVFLEAEDALAAEPPPAAVPKIVQKDATFSPGFLVVVAGQRVEMPNADLIFHNVFSYSKPNDFDLGTYPRGVSRGVTFRYPGLVRIYCSIHESMSASIFVVPTRWWTRAAADGSFAIHDVPPGRWRVRAWSWRIPTLLREVDVAAGESTRVELELGQRSRAPAAPAGDDE